jgi:PAS domain S-box-containing protein
MWLLAGVMAMVATGVALVALLASYRMGIGVEEDRLANVVESQARLLEAVARFDREFSQGYPGGAEAATLSQYREANLDFRGMGETGELTLAVRNEDWIRFLLQKREDGREAPDSVPWSGELAAPQRRALEGEAGVMVGLDYRGERVLAAYRPVGAYGWGIVAKMDLAEVRAPFLRAGASVLLVAALLIAVGVLLFRKLGEPFLRSLALSEEKYRLIADNTADGIWILDRDLRFLYVNPAVEATLGYRPEEWIGSSLSKYCSPEDFEKARGAAARMSSDPEAFPEARMEMELLHKKGVLIPVEVRARPLRLPDGEVGFQGVTRSIQERLEKEKRLREQAEEFEALFRASPVGLVQLDRSGRVRRWNPAASRIFGWGVEEVLDQLFPVREAGDASPENRLLRTILGDEAVSGLELTVECQREEPVEVRLSTAPIRDPDGDYLGVMASIEDISERRRAERVAIESQQRLEGFFYFSPAIQYVKDRQGRHLEVNRRFEEVAEVSREEALGKTNEDLFPAEIAAHLTGTDQAVFRSGAPYSEEESIFWSGQERAFFTTKFPMFDADMSVVGLGAISLEVTDRRKMQEALERSEAEYRSLVDNAPYGIFRMDRKGRFLSTNPALLEILGYQRERDVLDPDTSGRVFSEKEQPERLIRNIMDSHETHGEEVRWRRADGMEVTVRLTGRWVPGGEPLEEGDSHAGDDAASEGELELLAEDISQRRRLEDQLRHAQKMEAVGQLTGGIAHDFNNELSVILLNAEMIRHDLEAGNEVAVDDLEQIQDSAQRASNITRQLLGFSRRADLRIEKTDLASVVTSMRKLLRRVVREDIEVVVGAEEGIRPALVDPRSVEQMLLNLTSNAQDAMPLGGRLTVEVGEVEMDQEYARQSPGVVPGEYVRLRVVDTGSGMDPETRERVFEPFFTTKDPGSGTGLGLAMVYGLTNQQGGHVHLYSEPGEGTVVHLLFPVVEGEASGAALAPPQKEALGGHETILVVEDEHAVRTAAKRALERAGYSVLTSGNGKEAMDLLRTRGDRIDLVLSDLVMPEIGGLALYEWLQNRSPDTRFLLVSGYTGEKGGVDPEIPFVGKPWTLRELLTRVRQVLDGE